MNENGLLGADDVAWRVPILPGAQMVTRRRMLRLGQARDVTVVPSEVGHAFQPQGGPIWPDWNNAFHHRFNRGGRPVDVRPKAPVTPVTDRMPEAVWGGVAVRHFGHFIAEQSARLAIGALMKPDLPVLVGLPADQELPSFVRAVLDWYDIPEDRLHPVRAPLQVDRLWVSQQIEQLNYAAAPQSWLDWQSALAARKLGPGKGDEIVYVSRARLAPEAFLGVAHGAIAGEPALVDALERAGVRVVYPETLPLQEQLRIYRGARVLVFAEGSAVHALQLIGRCEAHVVILNRRPNARLAISPLSPRVHVLSYVEACPHLLMTARQEAHGIRARGLSIANMPLILRVFQTLGVEVKPHFDEDAYTALRDRTIRDWVKGRLGNSGPKWRDDDRDLFAATLMKAGLAHMIPVLDEVSDAP